MLFRSQPWGGGGAAARMGCEFYNKKMEKKKEVNTVVELDGFKMKWNTFRKPLVEVRDSL